MAKSLGIKKTTAAKRISRLIQKGVLSPALLVEPEYSRLTARAIISVKIAMNSLSRKKAPNYSNLREFVRFLKLFISRTQEWSRFFSERKGEAIQIVDVFSVAGGGMGTDVMLLVSGTSDRLLQEFVTDVIGKLQGVDETNTAAITYDGH